MPRDAGVSLEYDAHAAANGQFAGALFALFAQGGVRHVVVSPGARSAPLAFAADATAGLVTHVFVDERVGAFFALGLARATGQAVVFMCTSGTAGAHALPAVIEARHSGVPLVVLTADRPSELHDCGALQTVAQERFFGDAAIHVALEAPAAGHNLAPLRTRVAQILDAARFPAPGPVHVNVPLREPLVGSPTTASTLRPLSVLRATLRPESRQIEALRQLMHGARGAMVCGPLPPDPQVGVAVHALASALGWPVLAEPASQVSLGHDQPTLVSAGAALLRRAPAALVPEVVLRLGHTPTSRVVAEWLARKAPCTILVDAAGRVHDPEHVASHLVVADPVALCQALARAEIEPAPAAWLASWQRGEALARGALDAAARVGFWEGSIARTVTEAPGDLHLGNSLPIRDVELFGGRNGQARRVFVNRGASGIDGAIASALGEAAASGAHLCAVIGDLTLAHDVGGLMAAAATGASLTLVVIDNGGGGVFRTLPFADASRAFARYCLAPAPVDLPTLARAAGVAYAAAQSPDELARALTARGGIMLVHARVDGAASHRQRKDALAAVDQVMTEEASHV